LASVESILNWTGRLSWLEMGLSLVRIHSQSLTQRMLAESILPW
jgi:hypothetical protein